MDYAISTAFFSDFIMFYARVEQIGRGPTLAYRKLSIDKVEEAVNEYYTMYVPVQKTIQLDFTDLFGLSVAFKKSHVESTPFFDAIPRVFKIVEELAEGIHVGNVDHEIFNFELHDELYKIAMKLAKKHKITELASFYCIERATTYVFNAVAGVIINHALSPFRLYSGTEDAMEELSDAFSPVIGLIQSDNFTSIDSRQLYHAIAAWAKKNTEEKFVEGYLERQFGKSEFGEEEEIPFEQQTENVIAFKRTGKEE